MRKPVIGDLRVQEAVFPSGRVAYTILHPDGEADRLAEGFLRACNGGTDRAYAYLLVDHLRWLEFESQSPAAIARPALRHVTERDQRCFKAGYRTRPCRLFPGSGAWSSVLALYADLPFMYLLLTCAGRSRL